MNLTVSNKKYIKLVLRIFVLVLIAAVAILFFDRLREAWRAVDQNVFTDHIPLLLLSALFFVIAVCLSGVLWGYLLTDISGKKVSVWESIRIHASSWLLKYIPGQVGSVANKVAWSHKRGRSKRDAVASFIYENILTLVASLILSVPLVMIVFEEANIYWYIAAFVISVLGALLAMSPQVFKSLSQLIAKVTKREELKSGVQLSWAALSKYTLLYLGPRIATGIGFVWLALIYTEPTVLNLMLMMSAYIFASIVGLMAIFVPGGIGVREAVLIFLITPIIGIDAAIVLSILARFVSTAADLGVLLVYLLIKKEKTE